MNGPVLPGHADPVLEAEEQVLSSRGALLPAPTVGAHAPDYAPAEDQVDWDAYYTPLPIARALLAVLPIREGDRVLDPSAGTGAWLQAVAELRPRAERMAIDIDRQAPALRPGAAGMRLCADFLSWQPRSWTARPHWVVGNPPYNMADEHVAHALSVVEPSGGGVAMLLGIGFLAGKERWSSIYSQRRPRAVVVLPQRIAFNGRARDGQVLDGRRTGRRDNVFVWWDLGWSGPTFMAWLCPETMTVRGLGQAFSGGVSA